MATLYEMTNEIAELYDRLQDSELDDDIKDVVIENHIEGIGAIEKVEGYCQIIKQLNADAQMYSEEIKRLQARKKTAENSIERLKNALLDFMQTSGNDKFKAGTFNISVRKSKAVNVYDETQIPIEYVNMQIKVDKKMLGEALKNGKTIPGAEYEYREGVNIR